MIRLYKLLPDVRRQIIGFACLATSRDWRHQSNFSADAVGPVTLCQFSKSAFARSSENKPDLLRRINEVRELSRAQDHRGAPPEKLPLPMSHQDIADYLGLTVETVGRTFTKFERDGVIENQVRKYLLAGTGTRRSPSRRVRIRLLLDLIPTEPRHLLPRLSRYFR
jgi:CRP/FNR family transcriptional regulator